MPTTAYISTYTGAQVDTLLGKADTALQSHAKYLGFYNSSHPYDANNVRPTNANVGDWIVVPYTTMNSDRGPGVYDVEVYNGSSWVTRDHSGLVGTIPIDSTYYDSTNKKIYKFKSGTQEDVVSAATLVADGGGATVSDLAGYLPLTGGTLTGNLTMLNHQYLYVNDSTGSPKMVLFVSQNNHLALGYGIPSAGGDTIIYGTNISVRVAGTDSTDQALYIDSSKNVYAYSHLKLNNGRWIQFTDTNGNYINCLQLATSNNLSIGHGLVGVGDTNIYGTNIRFRAGGTGPENQVMLLTSSGNVGIGTVSPSTRLDVNGNVTIGGDISSVSNVYHTNGGYEYWKDSNGDDVGIHSLSSANNFWVGYGLCPKGYQLRIGGGSIQFYYGTSRTAGMILTTAGNLGVGTTSPSAKLHVVGDAIITGGLSLGGNTVVSVYSGSSAPSSSTGSNGDIYIQTL